MNIISVKYEDYYNPKSFSGRDYAYFSKLDLKEGDIVAAPTKYGQNIALVTQTNLAESTISEIKDYLKEITIKINRDKYLNFNEVIEEVA